MLFSSHCGGLIKHHPIFRKHFPFHQIIHGRQIMIGPNTWNQLMSIDLPENGHILHPALLKSRHFNRQHAQLLPLDHITHCHIRRGRDASEANR